MIALLVYLIGIVVARFQLQYWLRDLGVSEENNRIISILSALSWTVYPAYFIEYLIDRLNIK